MDNSGPVYLIDDDWSIREALSAVLDRCGFPVRAFASPAEFLSARPPVEGCLVVDLYMPGMSGLELQQRLAADAVDVPIIFITAFGDIETAVAAMKAGAADFIEKPLDPGRLMGAVQAALREDRLRRAEAAARQRAASRLARLTRREREILGRLMLGDTSRDIARLFRLSQRTIAVHRASLLHKTEARNTAELVLLAHEAGYRPSAAVEPGEPTQPAVATA